MTCRVCGESAPIYRTIKENDHIVRSRRCNKCGHEFITLEMDDDMWGKFSEAKKFEENERAVNYTIKHEIRFR